MKRTLICTLLATLALGRAAAESDSLRVWTLNDCLNYALEHNIQLQQSRNDYLSGVEDTKEARAALFPSLTASTSQSVTNYPSSNAVDRTSYTGTYGLEAGMTLYNGGRLRTAVKRQQLQNRIDELSVDEAANDIRIAIVQAYMQCLYAAEAVTVNRSTADASKAQRDRAEAMWQAGSISRVDFAQLESQYASDEYQVVVARSTLDSYKLRLKQLLELGITDEMTLAEPEVGQEAILAQLPAKTDIYATALESMPEIARGELAVEAAELEVREVRAGFLPTLALTAGIGTGHMSGGSFESGTQIWNRFNENVGLTLSIPIFSNRRNRTATNKARLTAANMRLTWLDLKKTLLEEVEGGLPRRPVGPVAIRRGRREAAVRPAQLRADERAVRRRDEEHRRAADGPERADGRPPGGAAGQVHVAAQHRAAQHLPGTGYQRRILTKRTIRP